jgi:membrane protein YdbS with pleckstrin-like domain
MNKAQEKTARNIVLLISIFSILVGLFIYLNGRFLVQEALISPVFLLLHIVIFLLLIPITLLVGFRKYRLKGKDEGS